MDAVANPSPQRTAPRTTPVRGAVPGPQDLEDLDALVSGLLTASRALVAVSQRSLADVEESVTLTQLRTLVVLDSHGEINLLRLAELLDVNSSTAMRTVDRLVASALATRRENPANRREVLLGLTSAGKRLVRQVTARRRAEIARIATAMPPHHRTGLVEALRAFADAAGEPDAGTSALGW
jgi:DNA-binding MarR family transcriptional regulator